MALKQLGSNSHLADLGVLLQHTRSGDIRLKDAAYQGLGHRIRLNRKTGDSTGIRQLFDSLKASAGENPDLHHVRAMAQISTDFARSYLADHCNTVEKMVAALRHDSNPSHPALLKAASAFLDSGSQEALIRPVLLEEVPEPATALEHLLVGDSEEADAGQALKRIFPPATTTPSTP